VSQERLLIETLLRIPTKDGDDVDFLLNKDQAAFDASATGRDIIAKYRQGGFSTYPLGRALVRCLAHRNRRHVIIAHNTDTTQKLLARIHYMIKHFKGPPPSIKYATQNRIVFDKMDSSIFIGTAGSDDYGVGDTITDLHCSEVSRWSNPQALLSGLFQAVPPSGNILLESTGRGTGNWFHQAVMRASRGAGYRLHFFNWLNTPEYYVDLGGDLERLRFMAHLDPTLDEPKYAAAGLNAGQLAWRRLKLEELNYDTRLFKENYPITLDECFQSTGFGVFSEINFEKTDAWRAVDPWTSVLGDHPVPGGGYVMGADPAGGVGKDYAVLEVFEAETGEQCLEYRNNMIEPDKFAHKVEALRRQWNNAYIAPERNNHGIVFIKELLNAGCPDSRLHRAKSRLTEHKTTSDIGALAEYGIYTSDVVKAVMIGELQKQVRHELLLHSEVLRLEMGSFIETDTGKMEAEKGCFDDCVMAAAMAAYVRPRAARLFAGLRDRAARARSLSTIELFEAGRAINELEERWSGWGGLPIESHVE
jgi:hypothetical protein